MSNRFKIYSKLRLLNLLYIGIICCLFSCDRVENERIPYTYVNFSIDVLSDPLFFDLGVQDNAMKITRTHVGLNELGFANSGVIVYNSGNNSFTAFDATCPHDIPEHISLHIDGNNIAECPTCKSKYVLPSEGYPTTNSVSKHPLKKYRTSYNPNTGVLRVMN